MKDADKVKHITEAGLYIAPDGVESASPEEESPHQIRRTLVHSFVIIPFIIATFGILLFSSAQVLTKGKSDVFQYLDDIRDGRPTKRWRAAFELSRLLEQSEAIPLASAGRFSVAMIGTFDHSRKDPNPLVRQYLALAMGRSGQQEFVAPLVAALADSPTANSPYIIHALGILRDPAAAPAIRPYTKHADVRVRLQAVIALGHIGDERSKGDLLDALEDPEDNIRWDAAVALAKMDEAAGKEVLGQLLDRRYLARFEEVDAQEVTRILVTVIEAGAMLDDPALNIAINGLAENDPNINVRKTALAAIQKRTEGNT